MKQKIKLDRFRVFYSVFVNGTEYPKDVPFDAIDSKHAEDQLEHSLKNFPENEYKIHRTEKIS